MCVCLCVCVSACHTCFSEQEDFASHVYSSVQKPKKVSAKPTAAGRDPANGSGCDELDATAQESKLVFIYMESNDCRYLYYNYIHVYTMYHFTGLGYVGISMIIT